MGYDPYINDKYQGQVSTLDDGYFTVSHARLLDALSAKSGRSGGLYKYVFADPISGEMAGPYTASLGVPHTAELNYVWGYYEMGKNFFYDNFFIGAGTFTYHADAIALGKTMKDYWVNFYKTGLMGSSGGLEWKPITATEKHT